MRRPARAWLLALVLSPGCGVAAVDPPPEEPAPETVVDLSVDRAALVRSLSPTAPVEGDALVDVNPVVVTFAADDCALDPDEALVGAPGDRRLLTFETRIRNAGDRDLAIGSPAAPYAPWTTADFHLSACHGHVHFTAAWVEYRVRDLAGAVVGLGHKQGFCIEDAYGPDGRFVRGLPARYGCSRMGLSAGGYVDVYAADLPGQWVDVTGVPAGEYVLEVEVNPERDPRFGEPDALGGDDVARVRILIPPAT